MRWDESKLQRNVPEAQAVFRMVTALLYMQHGFEKLFHFPDSGHHQGPFVLLSVFGVAGILETFGGLLILLGLFTRATAFILCGEMAVAYWTVHIPAGLKLHNGFFPVVNNGDSAVLFCFIYLYLCFAGPGVWSLDALIARRRGRVLAGTPH